MDYLEHHGIKGQRWGVRRFQNKDGTLTRAGRSRYDYRQSDSYKNGTRGERQKQSNNYNWNRAKYGERSANRIQYDVNEKGLSNREAVRKEKRHRRRVIAAMYLGSTAVKVAAAAGKAWYHNQKVYVQANNIGVREYARQAGIPYDDKVGYGLGFKAAARGKEFYDNFYRG